MKRKHVKHLLIDALEGLLTEEQKAYFEKHIEDCASCSRDYHALKAVYKETQKTAHPHMPESHWHQYWLNLQDQLDQPSKRLVKPAWLSRFSLERALKVGLAAAAVMILAIGLYWGDLKLPDVTHQSAAHIADVQRTAQSYFERSKILLTSLSNIETEQSQHIQNFQQNRKLSRELINQSNQLKSELDPSEQQRMISLINDLEIVLLQIANMDSTHDLNTLEMIQVSVKQRSILFKLNLQDIEKLKTENRKNGKEI